MIKLKHPFTMLVNGPTGCGKTQFCKNLLENATAVIEPPPQKIQWHYGVYQQAYNNMPRNVVFREGLPDADEFDGNVSTLLVLDDLMNELNERVSLLFTRESHHRNLSVIFITQNVFQNSKYGRTMNLNSQYLVLFKNPRDASQVSFISRQMTPGKSSFVNEAFKDATDRPYGYLFLDFKADTPEELRVRANVLPNERDAVGLPLPPYVYRPAKV